MTLRYMLDSNVCIRMFRARPERLRVRLNAEFGGVCISTMVVFELLHGAAKSARPAENRGAVEALMARLEVLAFDLEAASHAADIRAALERQGLTIGAYDLMIAGHARSRGLVIVTANRREFQRVDGLRSEDWESPA